MAFKLMSVRDSSGKAKTFSTISGTGAQSAEQFIQENADLWLDAAQITGLSDGDGVNTEWTDLTSNNNDLSQGTGAEQPTYETNEINGHPVVRFDGSDDSLDFTTGLLIAKAQGSLWVVAQTQSTALENAVSSREGTNSVRAIEMRIPNSSTAASFFRIGNESSAFSVTSNTNDPTPAAGNENLFVGFFDANAGAGNTTLEIDGVAQTSTATFTGVTANNPTAKLGQNAWNTTSYQVDIAEVITFDVNLTADQKALVENYLSTKYAITLS